MSIMCGEIIFHHIPSFLFFYFFLWLENVVIPNYNKYFKLTLTQKIKEPLSTCMSMCSEASILYFFSCLGFDWGERTCSGHFGCRVSIFQYEMLLNHIPMDTVLKKIKPKQVSLYLNPKWRRVHQRLHKMKKWGSFIQRKFQML